MLKFAIIVAVLCLAIAYPDYKSLIPNGTHIPDPCGGVWSGVGHLAEHGSGPLNQFGIDFAAAGHQWTLALCQMDSDGDGKTNGEELGDPTCQWTPANHFHVSQPTGHPGIDESTYSCTVG